MNCFYLLFILLIWSCESHVSTGLDNLESQNFKRIQNKNIALIINHTSLNKNGNHVIDLLVDKPNINVIKIFSPEHGYKGNLSAGEFVNDNIEPLTGAKIVSLYGVNKKPPSKELKDIDLFIYDIQDIGSRYYTYISSMAFMMDAAAENDIPFIVLDRPNPLGRKISGPILDFDYASFVGMFPIPIRHGMTSGELAKMINGENWLPSGVKADLTIINATGWDMEPGYFTIAPSPNIPDFNTALVYSGMCLLEGTNISEGRGTNHPFIYFGAPWVDAIELTDILNDLKFNGVMFEPIHFTPKSNARSKWPKYENEECGGSKLIVTDNEKFEPIRLTIQIIFQVAELYPEKFKFLETNFVDKLYGSKELRIWVESQNQDIYIDRDWGSQFSSLRKKYLIY